MLHRAPQAPLEGKVVVFDTKCTPKWSPNEAKTDAKLSKNRVRKRMDFCYCLFIVSDGFGEAKVVEKHSKSFSEDVRERKRRFPENVGFTIVKPWFSRPEAPQKEVILERKSLRACVASRCQKNTQNNCDFFQVGDPNAAVFE